MFHRACFAKAGLLGHEMTSQLIIKSIDRKIICNFLQNFFNYEDVPLGLNIKVIWDSEC